MSNEYTVERIKLAHEIAALFAQLPEVEAIALGGSVSTGFAGPNSDIDLYVYHSSDIPLENRAGIITPRASRSEIDKSWTEPADAWIETASGIEVDAIYRTPDSIEQALSYPMIRHVASVGYTTCFWHNVRYSIPLFDRNGWFAQLQKRCAQPYPEELAQAIIAKNHPILRSVIFSWLNQLDSAAHKNDLPQISHDLAMLFASYFDIVFAANRATHPGIKRQIQQATALPKHPAEMRQQMNALINATFYDADAVQAAANALFDNLDQMLREMDLIS